MAFLSNFNILNNCQHGFRSGKNTESAMTELVEFVLSALNNRLFVSAAFLDFSKAFDTVDHACLLGKLANYGIRGNCLSWIESFLTQRSQVVVINGVQSETLILTKGVPQGSTLGPILFLLYANDMVNHLENIEPIVYADDTTLLSSRGDLIDMEINLNIAVNQIVDWCQINQLQLNVAKTKTMHFQTKQSQVCALPTVMIGEEIVENTDVFKYLGVLVNENLEWSHHIDACSKKICKGLFVLRRLRSIVDLKTLISIYYAYIFPHLNYGCILWGNCSDSKRL